FSAAGMNNPWIRTPCRNTTIDKSEVRHVARGPYESPLIFLHGVDDVDDIRATSVTERMESFSLRVMKRSTPCGWASQNCASVAAVAETLSCLGTTAMPPSLSMYASFTLGMADVAMQTLNRSL